MNAKVINRYIEPSPARWPFRCQTAAWLTTLTLCFFGFLMPARGEDPRLTNTNHPMDTNVSMGVTVSFRVYASSTNPPMTYQWQHEGTNLPGATAATLIITNITVPHAGGYMAWVTNASGAHTNTRMATLIVDPTFTKILRGVIVTDAEGSTTGNWADYDNDGYVDLFAANTIGSGTTPNALYHNNRGANFSRVTTGPVATDSMRVWLSAWGDYDNDGNVDLVVANIDGGLMAQRLYRNNGAGSFTAVLDSALRSDTKAAACPWWFDYDHDGFLDLFMAKGTWLSAVANDCLFRNNGDGTFRKMTATEVGPMLDDQLRNDLCFSADYNNDGRQELTIYHTIPLGGDVYEYTNPTWRFEDKGIFAAAPIGLPLGALTCGDYDNDGWMDAFGNIAGQPSIFRSLGVGGFTNVSTALNVTTAVSILCPAFGDYDNDGWLDVYFTSPSSSDTPNGLFHNNRNGTFTQILSGSPVHDRGNRFAPSWNDYDNDGFLDLFITRGDGGPETNLLYRNNGNTNHWLKVKLDGRASNRSGIGAKVRAQATINGQTFSQVREINCGSAYVGQNGLLAHFGLGDATSVTTLSIEWPSGIVQILTNVAFGQMLTVVEHQEYKGPLPALAGTTVATNGLQVSIIEPAADAVYALEASTNLLSWTKLMARTSAGGTFGYTDTRMTNYVQRFYRVVVP